jgi:proline iminopeptidase
MQATEGHITTDAGVRLCSQQLGSGPFLVVPNGICLVGELATLARIRTFLAYDVRNRGRSDLVDEAVAPRRGIHDDVDDLEAVRRHLGIDRLELIGHSYMGLMAILYATKYPSHVERIVQIGPMEPQHGKPYPPELTNVDATLQDVFARLNELQKLRGSVDPEEFCRRFWSILSLIYVVNPGDANRIDWGRCDLPNERNLMKYWTGTILPSIHALEIDEKTVAPVKAPVLIVHGRKDRSAPYGGAREWASILPNARLVTVENAGHAPWIEAPEQVFASIETFLGGGWPAEAEAVSVSASR